MFSESIPKRSALFLGIKFVPKPTLQIQIVRAFFLAASHSGTGPYVLPMILPTFHTFNSNFFSLFFLSFARTRSKAEAPERCSEKFTRRILPPFLRRTPLSFLSPLQFSSIGSGASSPIVGRHCALHSDPIVDVPLSFSRAKRCVYLSSHFCALFWVLPLCAELFNFISPFWQRPISVSGFTLRFLLFLFGCVSPFFRRLGKIPNVQALSKAEAFERWLERYKCTFEGGKKN